jgi:methionyl-tRNA formyltransferase
VRIVFAGTPDFAVPPLKALINAGHDIVGVYTQPDRPQGRGRKIVPTPVKAVAESAGIPVFQPASFKDPGSIDALRSLQPELMVVVAYGLILPTEVIQIPPKGCVNIHASILPRWRGAAPIQRCILEGDTETGVTIMYIEPRLDAGPMILKAKTTIAPTESAGDLHDRLSILGAETLIAALPKIESGQSDSTIQNESQVTYAAKISKEEALLDFTQPSDALARKIRAFNPWPVAETRYRGEPLRIWQAEPLQEAPTGAPGTLWSRAGELLITTTDGQLRILELQLPGGRKITSRDFLNSRPELPVSLEVQ